MIHAKREYKSPSYDEIDQYVLLGLVGVGETVC